MANETRFVVGSAGGAGEGDPNFDLGHELDLVKAALLYADRVELVSAGSSLLYGFVTLSEVPPAERLAVVRRHAPTNAGIRLPEEQLEKMDLIVAGGPGVRRALGERRLAEVQGQLQAVVDQGWDELKRDVEQRFEAYNAEGMDDAVRSGLLDLHTFGGHTLDGMLSMASEGFTVEAAVEDILWEYVGRAQIAMDGDGYPLFDDLIGQLVSEAVRDGLIEPSPGAVHRGRHGGIAGGLLSRLPLFGEATVSEVLDVRREFEAPLAGFRGAVQALIDQRDRRREIEDNQLFFYYAAGEMVQSSSAPPSS